jgi:hypothetical protein
MDVVASPRQSVTVKWRFRKRWFSFRSGKAVIIFMRKLRGEQLKVAKDMIAAMDERRKDASASASHFVAGQGRRRFMH